MRIEPSGERGTRLTIGIEIPGNTNPINPALLERTLRNIKALIESEVPKDPESRPFVVPVLSQCGARRRVLQRSADVPHRHLVSEAVQRGSQVVHPMVLIATGT